MRRANLDKVFHPGSIALIGASDRPGSVGAAIAGNLIGSHFRGPVWFVNPTRDMVGEHPCSRRIEDLPGAPDLAVIASPASSVGPALAALGEKGAAAAVIVTAGFSAGERASLAEIARRYAMRIAGPNCLGLISSTGLFNASFSARTPAPGRIALLTQSGAVAAAMIEACSARHAGFSHILSLGDMIDIDFGDCIDALTDDAGTAAILIYAEAVAHTADFMTAARTAARVKPVVILKGGRSASGARAALSHTGALAGDGLLYAAMFERAGCIEVDTLGDFVIAAQLFSLETRAADAEVTVITNGGGLGVLAADHLERSGLVIAPLPASIESALARALPAAASARNPIDILGDAGPDRYDAALEAARCDPTTGPLLLLHCPTGVADSNAVAAAIASWRAAGVDRRPTIAVWTEGRDNNAGVSALQEAGIPCFRTPEEGVLACRLLWRRRQLLDILAEAPEAGATTERRLFAPIIDKVRRDGRTILTQDEAAAVGAAFGLSFALSRVALTGEEAATIVAALPGAAAIKILSPDITHKSDVGGVRVGIRGPEQALQACADIIASVRRLAPAARIAGFTVQEMIDAKDGVECIIGAVRDPLFGPCILFGEGGVATEVVADRALGLAPLSARLATDMVLKTRIRKRLKGYRNIAPARMEALIDHLLALSGMIEQITEIAAVDINPLLVSASGAIALDARIVLRQRGEAEAPTLLRRRPAPSQAMAPAGSRIRASEPRDTERLSTLLNMRHPAQAIIVGASPEAEIARLVQTDYHRDTVFLHEASNGQLLAVARLTTDPAGGRGRWSLLSGKAAEALPLLLRAADHARRCGLSVLTLPVGQVWRDLALSCGLRPAEPQPADGDSYLL
jgi:acetyltransferase